MPYGFVESFCGPGGLSLGLEQAGFTPLLAFDLNARAVETHRHNLPGPCIVADAARLTGREVLDRIGAEVGELALFSGGPPCQGFSKQKRGAHHGDPRNRLVLEFARLVREMRPCSLLFENVAIFGKKRGRDYLELITGGFDSFTRGRYGHPHHDRPLTPREAARLQGFPDDFVFMGTRTDIRSQIGNVVPPPLARAIGEGVLRVLRVVDGLEPERKGDRRLADYFGLQLEDPPLTGRPQSALAGRPEPPALAGSRSAGPARSTAPRRTSRVPVPSWAVSRFPHR